MKTRFIGVALVLLLAATLGWTQSSRFQANIPHEFTAAGKLLPAGQYEFFYDAPNKIVKVVSQKGCVVVLPVIGMLSAAKNPTSERIHITFNSNGNGKGRVISELWFGSSGVQLARD
jgi:hypothetical protein